MVRFGSKEVGDERIRKVVYPRGISNTSIKTLLYKAPPILISPISPDVLTTPIS